MEYISDYSGFSVEKLALLPQKQLQQPEKLFFAPASVSDRNGAAVRQAPARTQHPGGSVINSLFRFTFAADPEAAAFQAAFNAFQLPVVKQHSLGVCPPVALRIDKPSGEPAGVSVSVQIKSKAFVFVRRAPAPVKTDKPRTVGNSPRLGTDRRDAFSLTASSRPSPSGKMLAQHRKEGACHSRNRDHECDNDPHPRRMTYFMSLSSKMSPHSGQNLGGFLGSSGSQPHLSHL